MEENLTIKDIEEMYRLHLMVRQTNDINHKCRESELKRYHITPEQASVLICIQSLGDKATPANISRWLIREPHSVLIALRRMQKMGLIEMKPHKRNKHMFHISLTQTGQEAYLNSIKFRSVTSIFLTLPKEERQYLFYLLKKIRNRSIEILGLDVNEADKLSDAFNLSDSEHVDRKSTPKRKIKVKG